jgi:hypothetical protein|tara:strand:+ start:1082 stop:1357 length:276 start_codon:yes stop_codon:yes gene_type:complete
VNAAVRRLKEEAKPIARLLGKDKKRTVGWVYLWNSSDLSVLWLGEEGVAGAIEPVFLPEVLEDPKSSMPVDVAEFLEALSTVDGKTQSSGS